MKELNKHGGLKVFKNSVNLANSLLKFFFCSNGCKDPNDNKNITF